MNPDEYRRLAEQEATHWWYRSLHAAVFDLIERHRSLLPAHPRILDAGCGTGFVARRLAGLGSVAAVDPSPHAARYWKGGSALRAAPFGRAPGSVLRAPRCALWARSGLRAPRSAWEGAVALTRSAEHGARSTAERERRDPCFLRASVAALPFRDAVFDLIVSLDVLYHRAVGDDAAAARELARVLRPGGLLLLNLPAYDFLRSRHDRAIHTARRYTRGRVRELLSQAGLAPLRLGYWNTLLFVPAAAVRLWGRLRPGGEGAGSDVRPVPGWQNALFGALLRGELALRRRGEMPFGLSVIALARKAEAGALPSAPPPEPSGAEEPSCAS